MLLTPIVKIAGIYNKFCKKIDAIVNIIPLKNPKVIAIEEMVNPNIVPLNKIIINTINMPITVVPANHRIIANNKFFLIIYDGGLMGVDPRDPNLTTSMKMRILRECMTNFW